MPFSENSLRFLDENHEMNNREWFAGHKDAYKEHVENPMLALAQALVPTVLSMDPLLIVDPKRAVSKIWRDVRFSRDKTMFKRASWFVFQRSKGMVHPVWFFEFTPDFHRYGCGYYSAPSKVMAHMRELILDGNRLYLEAQEALDALPDFSLEGERYKRPRYPHAHEKQRNWLERKSITAMRTSHDRRELFSDNLPETLASAFIKLAPVYAFLIHAHESHDAAQENPGLTQRSMYGNRFDS